MKLQPDQAPTQAIQAAGDGWLMIDGVHITHSVLIGAKGENEAWDCDSPTSVSETHFQQILKHKPKLVLFGSGTRQQFIHPKNYQCLIANGIGIETMDTLAACRTYNVLAGEGRHVMAALILSSTKEIS